ncbi:alpha/beta hydrolase [Rhizobium sp. P38BS-XIX]|uniref:alpha/beta hydrolase family protein n=1 Tax=Rhizobium sp. P38BS-XIX TaxID=2726740 RepID=UPI001456F536|nr:alpha/beta hydrolase [Rhizobium sp. P38BS-XIX]NLS01088.1 alpha/beta hydrolase [Rhizobium sp. P38BS-XIX]
MTGCKLGRPRGTRHHLGRWLTIIFAGTSLLTSYQAFGQDDPGMPKSAAEASTIEQQDALPLTSLYEAPETLKNTKAGDLLRKEAFDGYTLPPGASATRILYHSTDGHGADVATSAVVLVPAGTPPAGGWPIIAWAHGTSGMARACAPSLMKDVYYGQDLANLLKGGFAIVATDYHGLGTKGPHRYMDKAAQADDVIYSVPAAQAAVSTLGKDWVVDGHSQGGLAAWGVAERQVELKDPTYRGAIAVAGAVHLPRLLDHPEEAKGAGFYFSWHAYAVQTRYKDFKASDMLSKIGMQHYEDATSNGCWLYGYASYLGVDDVAMLKPGWSKNKWVSKFYREETAGFKPIQGPILVLAGEDDHSVPIAGIKEVVERACKNKQSVTFKSYPGLDHDPTMSASVPDQLDWIRDRLSGKSPSPNCAN